MKGSEKLYTHSIELPTDCETACRTTVGEKHEKACEGKNVEEPCPRAGEFLQAAFLAWRETVSDVAVEDVYRMAVSTASTRTSRTVSPTTSGLRFRITSSRVSRASSLSINAHTCQI